MLVQAITYQAPIFGPFIEYRDTGRFPWMRAGSQFAVVSGFRYWYVNHFLGASLTGGGQLSHAMAVAKDALYRTDTSLLKSIRGPPPGSAASLVVANYVANMAVDFLTPDISLQNQYA